MPAMFAERSHQFKVPRLDAYAARDVQNAYDFIHQMIDPMEGPRIGPNDMEWIQLASLMRIVNRDLNGRLNAMERMMEPEQPATRHTPASPRDREAGPQ